MRFTYFLAFFLVILFQRADAQNFVVKGTILSEEDNSPLIGATVVEQGTSNGTTTDLDGKFSLQVSSGSSILEISYIGFERLVVPVQGRKELEIKLSPGSNLT